MTFYGQLHPYQVADVERMKNEKALLVAYGQGCLTGDTLVTVNRRGKGFTIHLDELVKRWEEGASGRWGGSHHTRYSDGNTYVRALLADGSLGRAQLVGVKDTGSRDVWKLVLSSGASIKATSGHEIMTPTGKVPLSSLQVGDGVVVDSLRSAKPGNESPTVGWVLPDGRKTDKHGYIRLFGTGHPRRAADGGVFEHHLVVEKMLGRWLASGKEVHHINGVRHDNDPGNLQVVTRQEHLALHNFRPNLVGVRPFEESVVSVEYAGIEHVYDLSVADDAHTWIGNGIVVGNTGKTVMTIACLEDLFDSQDIVEPGLVVCLAGLKYQWKKAIERFTCDSCKGSAGEESLVENGGDHVHTPTSTALVVDGTPKQRAAQYSQAWEYDYVILGYEQVANEWDKVKALSRGFVVCDEVSKIKGFRAQHSKAVKKLQSQYRYGLTGTPLENGRPEEIFSIFEWIDKDLFGRFDIFDKAFVARNDSGWVVRYRNIPTFRERLATRMVRRTPKDPEVSPYMPEEDHKDPFLVSLDRASRSLYNLIADELLLDLAAAANSFTNFNLSAVYGWGSTNDQADALRGAITSKMLALQMLCNHPQTLRLSGQRFIDNQATGKKEGSGYAADLITRELLGPLTKSPKMDATVALINGLLDQDPSNKVVLFTTYTDMVDLFKTAFGAVAVPFTGKQNAKQKEANKVRFQTDPAVRVLVSSDAGGYGVDLPQANWLLNYDQPDKAGLADQRDTRIVRASSQFGIVSIQSILTRNALEQRRHQSLKQKRSVAAAFIDGERINRRGGVDLDLASVTEFLTNTRP